LDGAGDDSVKDADAPAAAAPEPAAVAPAAADDSVVPDVLDGGELFDKGPHL
jgi:hypothetical protein